MFWTVRYRPVKTVRVKTSLVPNCDSWCAEYPTGITEIVVCVFDTSQYNAFKAQIEKVT